MLWFWVGNKLRSDELVYFAEVVDVECVFVQE